ncbi:MAG: hypothetical protein ABIH03_00225 [Pseudomonadota bacterium]
MATNPFRGRKPGTTSVVVSKKALTNLLKSAKTWTPERTAKKRKAKKARKARGTKLGQFSKLVSAIYKKLPDKKKGKTALNRVRAQVKRAVKAGKSAAAIRKMRPRGPKKAKK